jgi:hypothetical protein
MCKIALSVASNEKEKWLLYFISFCSFLGTNRKDSIARGEIQPPWKNQ